MITLQKKYISRFLVSLWVVTHILQLGHEYSHHIFSHGHQHHVLCSHHHKEVKLPDLTTDRVSAHDECAICDYEWFNLLESISKQKICNNIPEVIPKKLGAITDAINEDWSISPFSRRGPPIRI